MTNADVAQKRPKPKGTQTSKFGVSLRENHDASPFYEQFPKLKEDLAAEPQKPAALDRLYTGDSRNMKAVANNSVALVVTSPPYFAAKEYELERGQGGVPASYAEYLKMLSDVFRECWRVLEPGGRIAVNVANLGRKPYRSLSSDIIHILQNDLGFLLRGEVIWLKAEGASGSCAWGSFGSAGNPVLRDVTERVIVASKLRMGRAFTKKEREEKGFPHKDTISKELFMELTLDVWKFKPESAKRVGHPAPFPLELPLRFIELLTYEGDLVLDPFIGSGTTAIAARETGRHFVGYDLDKKYIALSKKRLAQTLPLKYS